MRQENLLTLRATIDAVKKEAAAEGSTRTIARAFDLIELILRAQEERLKAMDAAAAALNP
jgi:cobalamin biosynthesis Co2+ chelatase CbiK